MKVVGEGAAAIVSPVAAASPSTALESVSAIFVSIFLFALACLFNSRNDASLDAAGRRFLEASAGFSLVGMTVCIVGLALDIELWEFIVAGLLLVGSVGFLAAVMRRRVAAPSSGRLARWLAGFRKRWLYAVAVSLSAFVLIYVAWLFWNGTQIDGGDGPKGTVSRYQVHGTCTDGVCSVNECTTPKRCGSKAVGQLNEREVVEIVCQTRGGPVRAADGRSSTVWDELVNGNFVTDLYINTPRRDRFSPGIHRCQEGTV